MDVFLHWNVLFVIEPGHKRTEGNLEYFQEELEKNPGLYNNNVEDDDRHTTAEHSRYEELCRRPDPIVSLKIKNFLNDYKLVL